MEQRIDNFLDSIGSQLYMANIALSIILIIIGITVLAIRAKTKKQEMIGFICLGIGVLSVLSSVINLFYN